MPLGLASQRFGFASGMLGAGSTRVSDDPKGGIIELKKDAYPKKVLNALYKHTSLQSVFHVNMLALVDGGIQPRIPRTFSVR